MPNLEGNCSCCREYGTLDIILFLWGNQYEFCSISCLEKMLKQRYK
jgi:hypothetical protein